MSQINTWRKNRRQLAYSTVGTPDYIAPEIFTGQGYDKLCDWWSLGTIMYECLIGWAPFCAEKPDETYHKIVRWTTYFHFPQDIAIDHHADNFMRRYVCSLTLYQPLLAVIVNIPNFQFNLRSVKPPW